MFQRHSSERSEVKEFPLNNDAIDDSEAVPLERGRRPLDSDDVSRPRGVTVEVALGDRAVMFFCCVNAFFMFSR